MSSTIAAYTVNTCGRGIVFYLPNHLITNYLELTVNLALVAPGTPLSLLSLPMSRAVSAMYCVAGCKLPHEPRQDPINAEHNRQATYAMQYARTTTKGLAQVLDER